MTPPDPRNLPRHVAVIMDGNGRWAKKRGMNRVRGHRRGADKVREVVRASREIGIEWLTLYAFSEENWKRSKPEIAALMTLLRQFLESERREMLDNGIRLRTIGRTERLPDKTHRTLIDAIQQTAAGKHMTLTLALSYGGRQEMADAVRQIAKKLENGDLNSADISEALISSHLYAPDMPDPDLLIRTSGENRISNFLLWEIAYSELYFTPTLWPDFSREEYFAAIKDYQARDRRFGAA
ncbi:MAG: isoprenyl transferase [Deltaproteobacteria bacterium]|nr:isoprenyl transferase [Deltaproteobacteria bacterium]